MVTELRTDNAMHNWTVALACAPYVLEGANIDNPDKIQKLADSSASLHGLVCFVSETYTPDTAEQALLEWDLDVLAGASACLYRHLGLSDDQSLSRLERLSAGMVGAARYMDLDHFETWQSIREAASKQRIQ